MGGEKKKERENQGETYRKTDRLMKIDCSDINSEIYLGRHGHWKMTSIGIQTVMEYLESVLSYKG